MDEPHLHCRPDRLLRTCGYILLFLLCAGVIYAINWARHKKGYLRVTFSKIELEDDGTLEVEGASEYTTPIRITEFTTANGILGGAGSWANDPDVTFWTQSWPCRGCKFWLADAVWEITRPENGRFDPSVPFKYEFDPSARSVEMAKCGETYELHYGDSLVVCRVRGKSGAIYERRIEVIDPYSTEEDNFTRGRLKMSSRNSAN